MDWSRSVGVVEAELLRHRHGLGNGYVDLLALSDAMDIDVVRARWLDTPVEGKYVRRGRRAFIFVNTAHPGLRQRFTLAHELGHHCLAGDDLDVEFTDDISFMRSKATDERQANLFASALLMDAHGVRLTCADLAWDDSVAAVARQCEVSLEAAAIRLQELGLLDAVTVTAFLEDLKDSDWRRRFKRSHGLLVTEVGAADDLKLPDRFTDRVHQLNDAGVLSVARTNELLTRPRPLRVVSR
jgi:Zn-dependent peptidase ImmA (M78 family)